MTIREKPCINRPVLLENKLYVTVMDQLLKLTSISIFFLAMAAVTGCSNRIDIDQFTIEGTTADIDDVAQVSYNEDFQLRWDVTLTLRDLLNDSDVGYTAEIFLSENDQLNTSDDLLFYDEVCGTSDSPSQCDDNETGSVTCTFTENNNTEIECSNDNTVITDSLLDLLVSDGAFMILQTCHNDEANECDTAFDRIKLN